MFLLIGQYSFLYFITPSSFFISLSPKIGLKMKKVAADNFILIITYFYSLVKLIATNFITLKKIF